VIEPKLIARLIARHTMKKCGLRHNEAMEGEMLKGHLDMIVLEISAAPAALSN
jgi:hypothetical protein